jgi:hypothetical protein
LRLTLTNGGFEEEDVDGMAHVDVEVDWRSSGTDRLTFEIGCELCCCCWAAGLTTTLALPNVVPPVFHSDFRRLKVKHQIGLTFPFVLLLMPPAIKLQESISTVKTLDLQNVTVLPARLPPLTFLPHAFAFGCFWLIPLLLFGHCCCYHSPGFSAEFLPQSWWWQDILHFPPHSL